MKGFDKVIEIWKDVVVDKEERDKYKGLYKVSNLGRVKSIDRIDKMGRLRKGKMLKEGIGKNGYCQVGLCKDGKVTNYKVHRLVLLAFDEKNYFEGAEVNHKDEDPRNNRLDNIEWCTAKYNCNYGQHRNNISKSNQGRKLSKEHCKKISERNIKNQRWIGKNNWMFGRCGFKSPCSKPVICLNNLRVYGSARLASKELNCDNSTITKICKGKKKSIHGYKFKYYEEYLKQVDTEITIETKRSIVL